MTEEGTSLRTLGDLIDGGYGLEGSCYPCKQFKSIDIHQLAEKLGRDFVFQGGALNSRFRCKQCEKKTIKINLAVPPSS